MRTSPCSYNGMAVSPCLVWRSVYAHASASSARTWGRPHHYSATEARLRLRRSAVLCSVLHLPAIRVLLGESGRSLNVDYPVGCQPVLPLLPPETGTDQRHPPRGACL